MRAALLALLVLAPALVGGCLSREGEGPPLAQPTDKPIVVPSPGRPIAPTILYNFSDPGYRMEAPWRVGDAWDYESNQSHFRRVRVIDQRFTDGMTVYLVEDTRGKAGGAIEGTSRAWVRGGSWLVLNETENGVTTTYEPGKPLRYLRNGTFAYNTTVVDAGGRVVEREQVLVQARLFGTHQTLLFPWGYVEAKRVEETTLTRDAGGNRTQTKTMRWVHVDYLNDVQYTTAEGEMFKLTGARAGEFRRGSVEGS